MLNLLRASARRLADPLLLCAFVVLASSAIFFVFPAIDIWFSRLFWDPARGFFLEGNRALIELRQTSGVVLLSISAAVLASVILKLVMPGRRSLIPPRASLFLASTLALGPGLLVNVILKDNWGRPRPYQVVEFGGAAPYVDVWRMSDYCTSNCSFVSGEGSSAIWIMALALVVPKRWRLTTFIVTGLYALALSLNRVAFGGHFLSDVMLSWGLTLLLIAAVYRILYVGPPHALTDESLEKALTGAGNALRRIPARIGLRRRGT